MTAIETINTQTAVVRREITTIPATTALFMTAAALTVASTLMLIVALVSATTPLMIAGIALFTATILFGIYTGINALAEN